MTLEAGKEMDKRCVLNWLNEVYVTPSRAFNEYTEDELKMFAHDALVMLKEQEPKVLTLEEVEKRMLSNDDSDSIFYAEVRSLRRMSFGVFQLTFDSKDDYVVATLLGSSFPAWYRKESYGYKWRCWSARPTDEQRKAVKWNEKAS